MAARKCLRQRERDQPMAPVSDFLMMRRDFLMPKQAATSSCEEFIHHKMKYLVTGERQDDSSLASVIHSRKWFLRRKYSDPFPSTKGAGQTPPSRQFSRQFSMLHGARLQ